MPRAVWAGIILVGVGLFILLCALDPPRPPAKKPHHSQSTPRPTPSPTPVPLSQEDDKQLGADLRFTALADQACKNYARTVPNIDPDSVVVWRFTREEDNRITLHCKERITGDNDAVIYSDFSNDDDVEIGL